MKPVYYNINYAIAWHVIIIEVVKTAEIITILELYSISLLSIQVLLNWKLYNSLLTVTRTKKYSDVTILKLYSILYVY